MSSQSLTLEVPGDIAERLSAFATSRGLTPIDALEALLDIEVEREDEIDPEAVAHLEAAIKEAETDPGMPLDEAFDKILADFRVRHNLPADAPRA